MPTIQENKAFWDGLYNWKEGGDEWSQAWGSPRTQWFGTILPRIHSFIPTKVILEIACGYGRWTHYLKDLCDHLIAVDISEECIQACKNRFADDKSVSFHVNDGKSLDMAADQSVDFVFSMDSLVHVDDTVIEAYIKEINRILTRDGAAFLHHSNLGEYSSLLNITKKAGIQGLLMRIGVLEKTYHWRDMDVSAKKVEMLAEKYGMQCISQEAINWGTKSTLLDCFTIIARKDSSLFRENRVLLNPSFGSEIRRISRLYHFKQRETSWAGNENHA
jgi:ubiquinone/menaquinone biosynthesis C-methylase UbiE